MNKQWSDAVTDAFGTAEASTTEVVVPTNAAELREWARVHAGITVPDHACCPEHTSPADMLWEAFAALEPRVVWYASRGSGKSVLLALLGFAETILLGAETTILGGSLEQSTRVYEYMQGERSSMGATFWECDHAPVSLLRGDPTKRRTKLANGGAVSVLAASQKSARGPHPQRLRGDEIDEMDPDVWDAAQGQPMPARGIDEQVVGCSTWQNPKGTMTREFEMARKSGWPIRTFCWRCCLEENGGWLSREFMDRKRRSLPHHVWEVEYELAQPAVDGRLIFPDAVNSMFRPDLGTDPGALNTTTYFEEPQDGASYAAGADWAKSRDRSIIVVLRTDERPYRVVAFLHMGRIPFPDMVDRFNRVAEKYDAYSCHDATGIGAVIDDYLEVMSEGVKLVGKRRNQMFSDYVAAIENGRIACPEIAYMKDEHQFCTVDDVYGAGHPPDSLVAGALAWRAAEGLDLVI